MMAVFVAGYVWFYVEMGEWWWIKSEHNGSSKYLRIVGGRLLITDWEILDFGDYKGLKVLFEGL